ncbi:DUF805 domain-containing protein [Aeromonas veronii]|uniref:DUF805 domain-containing protein n=1 Tax=Aeromonas TaxID=642 RepID=UPI00188D5B3F|nr:DUF805 domain-containing protein [Aeromonas veronii]MBF3237597.1 DUF805 domain-containing protein [Aeromonas veronii]
MDCYFKAFKNYFNFHGRASRQEYFMFLLFHTVICVILALLFNSPEHLNYELAVYSVLTIIPCLSLAVRRIHDTNRTGWYVLIGAIPVIGFVLLLLIKLQKGSNEANRYGEALL